MNKAEFSFDKLKIIFSKYEAFLSSLFLILGFIFDYLTLKRVDFFTDNFFILLYLILAGTGILLINLHAVGKIRGKFIENTHEFLPFLLQFAIGGLFSAFVIFYSKSASVFTSQAFILVLFALLIGNEFFKKRYSKLVFQVGIYFVALFSFSIYFLPVLFKKMGPFIFLSSGAVSLGLIGIFILIIFHLVPARFQESRKPLLLTISILYIFINFLYFTNIIPPIPLSLKNADVYHLVMKQADGNYWAMGEKDTWREKFNLEQGVNLQFQESVYVFSSVFAPTDLGVRLIHHWQYFDESKNKWISANKISFPIKGGRDEGYRGFSKKSSIFAGKWRVDIETDRGQIIGRVKFNIQIKDSAPLLVSEII